MQLIEIKRDTAPKTGLRAEGGINYAIIRDANNDALYFTLITNTGGGYHSKELVSLSRIEACLKSFDTGKVVPAKALRSAFTGRSSNNAGFLAACLRHEGLLSAFPDATHQHQLGDDLTQWQQSMVALEGKPYVPAGATDGVAAPPPIADSDKSKKPRKGKADKAVDVAPGDESHVDPA